MKEKAIIMFMAFFCFFILGCGQQSEKNNISNGINIEAWASKDYYNSFGGSVYASPIEFRVDVGIKNNSHKPFVYDQIESVFTSGHGRPLVQRTFVYDKNKDMGYSGYEKGNKKTDTIIPGERKEFNHATDGYTFDLLRNAGDQPIKFGIAFMLDEKIVVGPFFTELPNLEKLLYYKFPSSSGQALELIRGKLIIKK